MRSSSVEFVLCLDTSAYSNFRRGNEREPDAFLDNPVLPVDAETSRHCAEIVAELRKAGTPVATNGIWIAAVAACNGTTVLTRDDHFECIGRVGSIVIYR